MEKTTNLLRRIAFSIGMFGCLAINAQAVNYEVNSSADNENDTCAINVCTLREAVNDANLNPGSDSITFAAPVTTITLTGGEITISDPVVVGSSTSAGLIKILGDAANNAARIFNVAAAGDDTTINKLELANGNAPTGDGGAISNNGAVLIINDSYIHDNSAANGNGGGISTSGGTVNLNRSTIAANGAGGGGGIYNANGAVNLINCTLSRNNAANFGGGYYGFATLSATTMTARNTTIAFNTALNGGGIAVTSGLGVSTASINNTIVSNSNPGVVSPPRPDLFGTIVSTGYNIVQDTSGATINQTATDQFGANPLLEPLAASGGSAPTHALRIVGGTSPAIDKGNSALPLPAVTEDQRGLPRPVDILTIPAAAGGNNADIGAFELQSIPTAASVTIGGRVISPKGRGVSKARVTMTGSSGESRTVTTNFFGYYRFNSVGAGETYIFNVVSKHYSFSPQVVTIQEELTELNFTAEP